MAQVSQQRGTCAAVFPPCLHAHPSCPPSRLCPARPCRAPPPPRCSECARQIAKEGHSVMWRTPLGLPVVQPYRRKERQHVRTLLQVGAGDSRVGGW